MAKRFTRQAFHDLVWSRPITQLAREFALSDVALHKICRKHDIPTPPVGWWARHAAGKPVERTPLRQPDDAGEIAIASPNLTPGGAVLAEVREQARVLASSGIVRSAAAMHPAIGRTLRTTRKVTLSEAGAHLIARLAPALAEIGASLELARSTPEAPAGHLRINTPRVAVSMALAPIIAAMAARHPKVSIELIVEDALSDIVAEGHDAGVRLGEMIAVDMVAVRLTRPSWRSCARRRIIWPDAGRPRPSPSSRRTI